MVGRISIGFAICFALVACSDSGDTSSSTSDLVDEGSTVNGVPCDASMDGEALCGDDTTLVYCSNGEWWGQDCTAQGADVCIDDGTLVDCVIESS